MMNKNKLKDLFHTIRAESISINDIGQYNGFVWGATRNKTVNQIFSSFDELLEIWEAAIMSGKEVDIERIKKLIVTERSLVLQGKQFVPDYTKRSISESGILNSFLAKLRSLSFKQKVINSGGSLDNCNCSLRLAHILDPLIPFLNKIGEGNHHYMYYTIFRCSNCSVTWVHDEVETGGTVWMEWDSEKYPIRR